MKELKRQLINALLVVLTAAAVISAAINFQQQKLYHLPDDGVTWVDRTDAKGQPLVLALYIVPDSAADRAGVKQGDILTKINNFTIHNSLDASRVLARVGPWREAEYMVLRGEIELKAKVIVRERVTEASLYYLYVVGLAHLIIGLFVYFRRSRARHALHFYLLCLASFVLFTFHYTGKLNNFDKVIYWGNVVAGLLAPTIFLHFALGFPERRWWLRARWRTTLLYLPALVMSALYFGMASGIMRTAVPLGELRWLLDRVSMTILSGLYLAGAFVAWNAYRRAEDPIVRQQLKWLRNGALFGVLPFTLFNTIPYLMGSPAGFYMNLAVLTLLLIPASWAYAILRYRLMDVDVIFQQGFTYTLATFGVMGLFYMLVLAKGPIEEMNPSTVALLLMVATFIFQPLRNWIQEILDRYVFYKDRYDYRRTLVEFARELSSETDLDTMLMAVADRLRRTLYIKNVAFFLADEGSDVYGLTKYIGDDSRAPDDLDLSFLTSQPSGTIFFERTRMALDVVTRHLPQTVRSTVAKLDLTYYIPCQVRGKTIAYLGASRTTQGEFLASQDLELLETLSGYVGIAIENARLYRSLQLKVVQYERLKEFSENIVESLNVGIVAADLDDRVESWNSQMEALTGITRERATRCELRTLFPHDLIAELDAVRSEAGVHQLYKVPLRARAWSASLNGNNGSNGHNGNGATAVMVQPSERLLNVAIAPLVTKDGDQIGRLIIFDDVTERAELEQRLVQTDKLSSIGLLAAGVAHEVNTPLAVISTYAQMLTKQISGDDPKSKLLEKIAKQTFRASEIVNSLLNFSRTSKTEFEEVDLNRVVRETLSLIEHQLEKSGVRVEFEGADALGCVRGNFGKLQQVFLNLFLNARDAMDVGGALRVCTKELDSLARVEVTDSGRGINPEDLTRIYDPFFTTKGAKKGTGLGLAVTYGIVREHGGTIDVKSTVGEGTTFTVELPLVRKTVNA
ncbi:MAG: PAS domain S-box protein [Bryobacterales bacterium]|nr:PAS domain S-box protein [Bryobacterales bacterium]